MSPWLRRTGLPALFLFLVSFAYHRVLPAGFVGEDFAVLAEVEEVVSPALDEGVAEWRALYGVHGMEDHPLAAASLAISCAIWSPDGRWDEDRARFLRGENLILLLLGAVAIGWLARRGLLPWTGHDQARAAGLAVMLVVGLHPLSLPHVATIGARGDLVGFALASFSAALFLIGRQDRRPQQVALAGVLAILAGFASELAVFLPICVAAVEFFSVRRTRPRHTRWRTAATTLVVFGACVAVEVAVRALAGFEVDPPQAAQTLARLADPHEALRAVAYYGTKIGLLILPANPLVLGVLGFFVSGGLWLACVQPALLAMRAAPRLWGWLAAGWFASTLFTLLPTALVRVSPEDLTHAATLFAPGVVMSVGLGLACTALSGWRRSFLPVILAIGYGCLTYADGKPWVDNAKALERLGTDLWQAREVYGAHKRYLVVDPPEPSGGLRHMEDAIRYLGHPLFAPLGVEPKDSVHTWTRGLSHDALLAVSREPELATLREEGLVLLLPPALLESREPLPPLDDEALRPEPGSVVEAAAPFHPRRLVVPMDPLGPPSATMRWLEEGSSPYMDLDPLRARALRVEARTGVDTSDPPRLAWRAREARVGLGYMEGVWLSDADAQPIAWFAFDTDVRWLLSRSIRRIVQLGPLVRIRRADLLEEMPAFDGELIPGLDSRGRWFFDPVPGGLPELEEDAEPTWSLTLVDPESFAYAAFPAEPRVLPDGRRVLEVPAATEWFAELLRSKSGRVAWSLAYQVRGVTLRRAGGRRGDE